MTIAKTLLVIGTAVTVSLAQVEAVFASPDWRPIGDSFESRYFIDKSSVRRNGDTARAWFKIVYNRVQSFSNEQIRTLSVVIYADSEQMSVVDSRRTPGSWTHIPPDSSGSNMLRVICK